MKTLYVSQQGCYVALKQESLVIRRKTEILARVQLPLLEQVLIFGKAQVTTQAIHVCLKRQIPILYLSRMGYCYGRILAIEQGYRPLFRFQQQLGLSERMGVARLMVLAKIKNCRVILQRQQRRLGFGYLGTVFRDLDYFAEMADQLFVRSFWARFWNYQQQNEACSDHQRVLTSGRQCVLNLRKEKLA